MKKSVNLNWLVKWHANVIRECGTDDIADLIAHARAYRAVREMKIAVLIAHARAYRAVREMKLTAEKVRSLLRGI